MLTGWVCVVTTVPVGVVWVVWVVVMIGADALGTGAAATGGAGGGAETTCDSGSDTHPAVRPIAATIERNGASDSARVPF